MSKGIESEKIKKLMNRKILLGVSSLFICIVLIAVCSFVPFIIDPTQWQTVEFLTDELIIVAIVIAVIVVIIVVITVVIITIIIAVGVSCHSNNLRIAI